MDIQSDIIVGPRISGFAVALRRYVLVLPDGTATVQTHTADDDGGSAGGECTGCASEHFHSVFEAMMYAVLMVGGRASGDGDDDGNDDDDIGGVRIRVRC